MVWALVFEIVATFLFLVAILGVTHPFAPTDFAGLAIGLTLVVIHLVGINITGTSVNPARASRISAHPDLAICYLSKTYHANAAERVSA
jgi:glycerol uptake facilitator-like aquaporin